MNSSWLSEIWSVIRKELQSELRGKSGLITAAMFSIVSVIAMAMGAYGIKLRGGVAAGLLWVGIMFAVVVTLPRVFLQEEEQGTMDLLRLMGRGHAVFWGKALYSLGLTEICGFLLSGLFMALMSQPVLDPGLLVLSIFGGCAALSGTVTLCSALVAHASNRAALAATIAIPLLLPVVALSVSASQSALGGALPEPGYRAVTGLFAYAVATFSIGPGIFALVWKS
jgi:heme exporter protein B